MKNNQKVSYQEQQVGTIQEIKYNKIFIKLNPLPKFNWWNPFTWNNYKKRQEQIILINDLKQQFKGKYQQPFSIGYQIEDLNGHRVINSLHTSDINATSHITIKDKSNE